MLEELPIPVYIKQDISVTWLLIQSKVKKLQVCNILYNVRVSVSKKRPKKQIKAFISLFCGYLWRHFVNKWWSQWIYLNSGSLHLKSKR